MSGVFISYSHKDRPFVERLAVGLKAKGLNLWYDQWELKIGDSLVDKINYGIKSQDFLITVLSKSSVKSEWVRRELNAALIKELQERRVVILPIVIEDCDIPPLLSDKVYADFRGSYLSGLNKLLDAFPGHLFPSGIDVPSRKALSSSVHLENVITTNVLGRIVKP